MVQPRKLRARFGLAYLVRHPYPHGPVIPSGLWAGWRELGYTTDEGMLPPILQHREPFRLYWAPLGTAIPRGKSK